jgi:hypothetical protein
MGRLVLIALDLFIEERRGTEYYGAFSLVGGSARGTVLVCWSANLQKYITTTLLGTIWVGQVLGSKCQIFNGPVSDSQFRSIYVQIQAYAITDRTFLGARYTPPHFLRSP